MSIEKKRNLLRITRERFINNLKPKSPPTQEKIEIASESTNTNYNKTERIKTTIKSSYLGNTLYPNYINKFSGETFIVAGCGSSINLYDDFSKYYVIGVNDVERILTPDFLVVVNDHRTFMRGRWDYVKNSLSPVIFSHLDDPGPINRSSRLSKIKIGSRNSPNLDNLSAVDYTMNSPYMAVIIAYQLGAKKIGMVGVDFTQDHFFANTGTHKLSKHLKNIDQEYLILKNHLEARGVKVAN
ncbi:MAG: hypothetical protein EBS19_06335, partial [Spirochaetia bacterium]|nr:hypothetical protein [Spirochaetia bacterium]